ncbi:hypothetical protein LINGRAHAP2_LOCUS22781 [Linum grandiflorum]
MIQHIYLAFKENPTKLQICDSQINPNSGCPSSLSVFPLPISLNSTAGGGFGSGRRTGTKRGGVLVGLQVTSAGGFNSVGSIDGRGLQTVAGRSRW